jgi:nicotinate-nucleotide adenylyltransferase
LNNERLIVMKIGIFGGSFNPVHSGHVNLAKKAIGDFALDRLVVIPANVSPFKTDGASAEEPAFSPDMRLMLVRAAFNGVAKVVVDDRELKRGGVSFAIDTVREIAAENEGAAIVFLVGEDSVEGLPRWKDYDSLVKLCRFESYPRTKESSTEVRRRLKAGEPIDDLVPQSVAMFIKYGVRESEDAKIVAAVRAGLIRKDGFCPCRLPKLPEFFCPCDEFKKQMADPAFHGLCHCRLYLKP